MLTVFQPSPSCDHGHASREVILVVRHTNWHYVLIVVDRRLELQQGYVVLESRRVVLPMDDDTFHVLADAPLGLDLAADVILAENCHQVRQKSVDNRKVINTVTVNPLSCTSLSQYNNYYLYCGTTHYSILECRYDHGRLIGILPIPTGLGTLNKTDIK